MTLVLGVWGKIATMGVAAIIIFIVMLVVVCFVGPGCWGYEWLNADEERERRRRRLEAETMASTANYFKMAPLRRQHSNYDTAGSASSLLGRMDVHRDSTYSSMSEATDRSSLRSTTTTGSSDPTSATGAAMTNGDAIAGAGEAAEAWAAARAAAATEADPPQLHITLQFITNDERRDAGRLLIGIKSASRLPGRMYAGGLEPFVSCSVVRCSWPLHRRAGAPVHCMRTRALRHTHSPYFDQTFAVDARRHDIKEWSLRLCAFDQDRHGNATELCFVDVALRDVKALVAGQEAVLTLPLQISDKENGEVLVGLSFLPTAQRLCVSVIRAKRLRYLEVADSLATFHPYVRVVQLHGTSGRSLRRKKTSIRPGSDTPEFGDTLTFDLTAQQLESAVFLVLLCSRTPTAPAESPPADPAVPTPEGSPPAPPPRRRDLCLGKVALGRCVAARHARHHWMAVMQSPRSVHSAWHPLK